MKKYKNALMIAISIVSCILLSACTFTIDFNKPEDDDNKTPPIIESDDNVTPSPSIKPEITPVINYNNDDEIKPIKDDEDENDEEVKPIIDDEKIDIEVPVITESPAITPNPTTTSAPTATPAPTATSTPSKSNPNLVVNPNSFADQGRWAPLDNPIPYGEVGNINFWNHLLYTYDGSSAIVQIRIKRKLSSEEAKNMIIEYNKEHSYSDYPEYTKDWSWQGVCIEMDLKNFPVSPDEYQGDIIINHPALNICNKEGKSVFVGSSEGVTSHLAWDTTFKFDREYHKQGDIIEWFFVYEKPDSWSDDDLLIKAINYYGRQKEDQEQYTFFKLN